jgi:hypothetical protein
MEKTIGSLFDGIGGFPLAGSYSGFTALGIPELHAIQSVRFCGSEKMKSMTLSCRFRLSESRCQSSG